MNYLQRLLNSPNPIFELLQKDLDQKGRALDELLGGLPNTLLDETANIANLPGAGLMIPNVTGLTQREILRNLMESPLYETQSLGQRLDLLKRLMQGQAPKSDFRTRALDWIKTGRGF